jgi:predicted RNA-binding protein associated with RNAse of E/G family
MHLKVETHHLLARMHSVKAGNFPVQLYQEHPHGLYVERDFYGHPAHKHWQAHILPALNLQVCRFVPHRGTPQWEYYVDIVQVERQPHLWRVQDLYLDVVVLPNRSLEILDTDELLGAAREGLITYEQLALALHTAHALVNRLSAHGNDLALALAATGIVLNWEYNLSPTL